MELSRGYNISKSTPMSYIIKNFIIFLVFVGLFSIGISTNADIRQKEDNLTILANAIQVFEGYHEGSLSYRNNNPGNLRHSPFQAGRKNGFAYFSTYEEGFEALRYQLAIAAMGDSRVYTPDMTLSEFFNVYAPPHENQPNVYTQFVLEHTGFNEDMQLKELL